MKPKRPLSFPRVTASRRLPADLSAEARRAKAEADTAKAGLRVGIAAILGTTLAVIVAGCAPGLFSGEDGHDSSSGSSSSQPTVSSGGSTTGGSTGLTTGGTTGGSTGGTTTGGSTTGGTTTGGTTTGGTTSGGTTGGTTGGSTGGIAWDQANATEQAFFNEINAHRQSIGLNALTWDPILAQAARWHSEDMAARNYADHFAPDPAPHGVTVIDRVAAAGGSGQAGEIIGGGISDAATIVQAWLGSPDHRAHIENTTYSRMGVGYVDSHPTWGDVITVVFQ